MKSIWILAIDTSGSMQDAFSKDEKVSEIKKKGLTKRGVWRNKIEAAKEIILKEISTLRQTEVAIINFNSYASVVYQGSPKDYSSIESIINNLRPNGNTNFVSCLNTAWEILDEDNYQTASILIITDGLANSPNKAQKISKNIKKEHGHAQISIILIDGLEKSIHSSENIITPDGKLIFAESYLDLEKGASVIKKDQIENSLKQMESKVRELSGLLLDQIYIKESFKKELDEIGIDLPKNFYFEEETDDPLTIENLDAKVIPYLKSLEELQTCVNSVEKKQNKVRIHAITKTSPIKLSVSGIAQAFEIVERNIIPWKRDYAKKLANIDIQTKIIEKNKIEQSLIELKNKNQRNQLDNEIVNVNLEGKILENEKMKIELAKQKYLLAKQIIEEYFTNLKEEEKAFKIIELLPIIEKLIKSPEKIKLIENVDGKKL